MEPGIPATIHQLARLIQGQLSAGDVAELRRLDPERPFTAAFWKLVAGCLVPAGHIPDGDSSLARERERRWAVILAGLAHLGDLHRSGTPLGRALAAVDYAELRLQRLLRASGAALFDQALGAARFLSAKRQPADWTDAAFLILFEDGDGAERSRRRLARDFFSQSSRQEHSE